MKNMHIIIGGGVSLIVLTVFSLVFGLSILFSFLVVAGLGIAFGIILAIAAKVFEVKKDERLARIEQALPGLNCGTCGYPGCSAYAEAVGLSHAELTLCLPGGDVSARTLAKIMGVEISVAIEKKVTQVHCRGGRHTSSYSFHYSGVRDCNALAAFYGGDKTCKFGCLSLGSCIRVCPVDAISYDKSGLVWVDSRTCVGCGKCIDVCPTGVMRWLPKSADVLVACNSTDKTAVKKKYCSVSCIGCKICEKQSPGGGFTVENFLARIDYTATGERENARQKCPTSCIIKNENAS